MKQHLRIAAELSLPVDAVTQKIAWLGRTGSGKTYGCKRMVEQMLLIGAQVVVLDSAGVWPGLRRGKKSFDVPVFGGLYGDVPLESTAGQLVADVVVDRATSAVLDVSQMLDAERIRFSAAFAQRLFQRRKATPAAMHLVLEECQDYVPENQQSDETRMLHEFVRLSKQGRSIGIGISFVSQRPQDISKKALNQVECVFAFQMTGPQERKALQYWLSDKGFEGKLADILPTLDVGAPHVWSPQWLKVSKIVHVLPIESADTSQTPQVGQTLAREKLRPIDLAEITAAMAATIERAKLEDPKALRARIAELERAAKQKAPPAPLAEKPPRVIERPVFKTGQIRSLRAAVATAQQVAETLEAALKAAKALAKPATPAVLARPPPARPTLSPRPEPTRRHEQAPRNEANTNGVMPVGERAVLVVAAMYPDGVTREQVSILSGYKKSTRDTYLHRLRERGYLGTRGTLITASADGVAALGDFEPLPTGDALRDYWLGRLPDGERKVLAVLCQHYPEAVDRETIGNDTDYKKSTRDTYLHRLRARKLVIDAGGGTVKAAAELFD